MTTTTNDHGQTTPGDETSPCGVEPKRCPFCLSEPEIETDDDEGDTEYAVRCHGCGMGAPWVETETRAVALWNELHYAKETEDEARESAEAEKQLLRTGAMFAVSRIEAATMKLRKELDGSQT